MINSSEMTTASTPKTEAAATKNTFSTTIAKMVATREMKTTSTEIAATAVKTTSSTTNAAVHPEKVLLVFAIMTTFTSDLTDKNSMVYKVLETTVVTELSKIFEKQYGDIFIGVIILQFRPGSVFVDSEVKLNTSASISPSSGFPTPKDLKEVLVEAITNNTISSFNISVESISSQVLIQTTLQPSTGRTTTVSLSTKKSNIVTSGRHNDSTVTASTSTASLPTTTLLTTTVRLRFSLSQNFVQELANNNSPQFLELAAKVTLLLNKVYTDKFGSQYRDSKVIRFSRGSVVTDVHLTFSTTGAPPSSSQVINTLVMANSSISSLTILPGSIQVMELPDTPAAGIRPQGSLLLAIGIFLLASNL
nr:P cell-type agglutination protein map4-like [Paramormyrops kingsleyae]